MSSQIDTPEGRKWIVEMLRMGPVKVIFTKSDGSERIMNCTLKSELAEEYERKTEREKKVNIDVCPVYDLDAKGWRSFRYDSVKAVELEV